MFQKYFDCLSNKNTRFGKVGKKNVNIVNRRRFTGEYDKQGICNLNTLVSMVEDLSQQQWL